MDSKLRRMDAKALAFIERYFVHAPLLQREMIDLWSTFRDMKLPNDDFLAEFTNGKKPSLRLLDKGGDGSSYGLGWSASDK